MQSTHPARPASPSHPTRRVIALIVLLAYGALLVQWMVFKDLPTITIGAVRLDFSGTDGGHPPNLVPFRTILPYLLGRNGLVIDAANLVGNIVVMVPIGLVLPLVWTRITWKEALAVAVGSGLSIETMQSILHVGVFDIDDVILNALGVMIGYAVSRTLERWVRARSYRSLALSGCLVVAAAAAIFAFVIRPISHAPVTADVRTGSQAGPERTATGVDPCNGTGGTGKVAALGPHSLTLQPRDGSRQVIDLTDRTVFKDAAGPVSQSDLRVGNRVTLVINEGESASVVLVCGTSHG